LYYFYFVPGIKGNKNLRDLSGFEVNKVLQTHICEYTVEQGNLLMNKDNRICIYSLILVVNPINHGVVFTDHGVVYKDHAVVCRIEVDPI